MDLNPVDLINVLLEGGAPALFLILAILIWFQHKKVVRLSVKLEILNDDFTSFRIKNAEEGVTKKDLVEIKTLIQRLFDLMENRNMACGSTCYATKIKR